jgi:hypothetical protein
VGNRDQAEDLAQDVFLRVYRALRLLQQRLEATRRAGGGNRRELRTREGPWGMVVFCLKPVKPKMPPARRRAK